MENNWKDVPGFEGLYEANEMGEVKSKDRVVSHGYSGTSRRRGKVLKGYPDKDGYLKICLSKDGKQTFKAVHQVIAMTFLNHHTSGSKIQVNHINKNKADNSVENLELLTAKEHIAKDRKDWKMGEAQKKQISSSITEIWRKRKRIDGK